MAEHHKHAAHGHPEDSPSLHESYGPEIPEPSTIKGTISNFGWLAGSGDLEPKRNIHFNDSIEDNYKNQPKARGGRE